MAAPHGGTRWRRQSVHTPPLSPAHRAGSASTVRTARSLRTPAAGPHRGPLLQLSLLRRSLRGEVRRGRGRRSQHGPRGPWGHRIAVLRRQWIDWDYSRAHSPMCPRSRGEIADLLFQALDEESKLPCAFDYELHPPAYPCKGDRHSINAMYHCKGSLRQTKYRFRWSSNRMLHSWTTSWIELNEMV